MEVHRIDCPDGFLRRAGSLLIADEARHSLALGLTATIVDHPEVYPERRFWVVEDDGAPVAAALRTPPQSLVLARPATNGALATRSTSFSTANESPGPSSRQSSGTRGMGEAVRRVVHERRSRTLTTPADGKGRVS
jgi:hypothetical protein